MALTLESNQSPSGLNFFTMTIKDLKKQLGLSNADLAEMFGYKDANSFANSTRRKQVESGAILLYQRIKEKL